MAFIRATTELPSGIFGWYIYYDVNGKMFISSPSEYINHFHTREDLICVRDILNKAIKRMTLEGGIK